MITRTCARGGYEMRSSLMCCRSNRPLTLLCGRFVTGTSSVRDLKPEPPSTRVGP